MTAFGDLLARRLASDPGQPFVTFYDDDSGERTELSVKTWANWVSKTANLYADELMLDPGDDLCIDLPPHWLGTVFIGAVWLTGLGLDPTAPVAIVGPEGVEHRSTLRATTTMACSLRPFAVRFAEPLPPGILDHGELWAGQGDVFATTDAHDVRATPDDRRVITDTNPTSASGQRLLADLLAGSGSLVLVANADASAWPAHSQNERATAAVRTTEPT
jgi:uncharacterized protein (TIGR03089 family)